MPKIKICGITNHQDALWASNLGADLIGLNFCSASPRKVSVKNAMAIVDQVPGFMTTVGVFVDEPMDSLKKIVTKVPLRWVQLHGTETPDYCREVKALGVKVIKALRLQKALDATDTDPYTGLIDFFLFDTYVAETLGGTRPCFSRLTAQATDLSMAGAVSCGLNPG